MNSQDIIIDAQEKRQGFDYGYSPKMFSAYFRNVGELQEFLRLSKYLVSMGTVTETLGMNYKIFKGLKTRRVICQK